VKLDPTQDQRSRPLCFLPTTDAPQQRTLASAASQRQMHAVSLRLGHRHALS
jgi:hypothetical protein